MQLICFCRLKTLKFPYSKEECKVKDAWKQGAEKTLDIRAEGIEGGGKYVMNSGMICTLHKIIRVTKYRGMRCRGCAYSKLRTPHISRKSTFCSVGK